MSKRRYIEKIADISGETVDICEKSLIYFSKYQMGYVKKKLPWG
ncbi:PadR family transcriptional regulator [Bacillus thuringiensis]|nr:PadR family transcriptional regulator [Bacillus thuringiensis]